MKIGTDMSIAECRDEGYLVIEFKKRELYKKKVFQKDASVICSMSFPHDGYGPRWKNGRPVPGYTSAELWLYKDVWHSWETALWMFEQHEDGILKSSGADSREEYGINFDDPNEYDLLHLLSDVCSYCGLE